MLFLLNEVLQIRREEYPNGSAGIEVVIAARTQKHQVLEGVRVEVSLQQALGNVR